MVDNFWQGKRVIVTGGSGFLGSHLAAELEACGVVPFVPRSAEYDLRTPDGIGRMFAAAGPVDILFHLAGNVGGIGYNQQHPYRLFYDNAVMGIQVIHQAIQYQVGKLVLVGSVCAYPKHTPVPFSERNLWEGYPEATNAPYGLAKKMLLIQLQAARAEFDFNGIFLLPTNLYGPRDNFNPATSHVIPALIRKCVEAREARSDRVVVWGTGNASRDFLFVRDAARALLLAAEKYDRPEPLNLGSGAAITIAGLVHHIKSLTGFDGQTVWDTARPDGQPRRQLDVSAARQALGWQPEVNLRVGLQETIAWFERAYAAGLVYHEREEYLA